MVGPVANPNFETSAENGIEAAEVKETQIPTEFVVSFGEHVAALLANFVAEERKTSGAPLNYQFTHYDVVQDLLGGLRDDGIRDQEQSLLGQLLDPKPPPPVKEELPPPPPARHDEHDRSHDLPPHRRDDFRRDDRDDWRRDDRRDWRRDDRDDRGDYGRGRPGYNNRPDQRGSDGRSLCRWFQSGRCTYGNSCKFAHEKPRDGPY